ncbi:MAG: T9SS type A sorting domain-containing protein [Bacteroidaceae bacterium]|nr:T9SS type A sorting domain-containing protein [Bacteroidaceae bacterium]
MKVKHKTFTRKWWACSFLMMMCLFPLQLMAEDVQQLVISKNDGTEVSFLLSEEPKIKFQENNYSIMEVSTPNHKMKLSTFDLNNMKVITVDLTNIVNITDEKVSFVWKGDALMVNVSTGTSIIAVYDMAGKEVLSKTLAVGKHALSLSDLPKGVYIVKISGKTIKILNP